MNILIKNKLVVAIALGFVVSGAQASILVEDVKIDNSTYGTAQDVGTLSSGDLVKLLGFRGSVLGGSIIDDNKADFYRFTLTSPAMLTLNVFTDGNDPILGLYDDSGTQRAFNDDGAADFDSFLQFDNLEAGTYYAAVSGFSDNDFSTANGDTNFLYNLQIETAAPIPLPLAVWTFGAGLFGMLTLSKRRKFF